MRLFQAFYHGRHFVEHSRRIFPGWDSMAYAAMQRSVLDFRFNASHFLKPFDDRDPDAQWTSVDDPAMLEAWRRENGMPARSSAEEIVLAQVEQHRPDVVYSQALPFFDSRLARRLPGCVKVKACWHAAPVKGEDLSAFDLLLSNFTPFIEEYRRLGGRAEMLQPAHDPVAEEYDRGDERPVDIAFVGSYSRHHARRNRLLEPLLALAPEREVAMHFIVPTWSGIAARVLPGSVLSRLGMSRAMLRAARAPLFGRQMYALFGRTKLVVNAAIDMSGEWRGNMRCFEAMGCGAHLVSDPGKYPAGWQPETHFTVFDEGRDLARQLLEILDGGRSRDVARAGAEMMRLGHGKAAQWQRFQAFVAGIAPGG